MIRKLGYREDPPDPRDWSASEKFGSSGPVPQRSDNRHLIPSILDQGGMNSCVANAVAQAVRASHIRQGAADPPLLSRHWLYYLTRKSHHEETRDEGTFIRNAFFVLDHFGFPPESVWPYIDDGERVFKKPDLHVYSEAYDQHEPTKYRRIFETGSARVDMCKRALADGHLIVFGTDISDRFVAGDLGDDPIGPPVGISIAGGHAMVIRDHDRDVFNVVGSWAEKETYRFSADYVAWDRTRDLWVVESAPGWSE